MSSIIYFTKVCIQLFVSKRTDTKFINFNTFYLKLTKLTKLNILENGTQYWLLIFVQKRSLDGPYAKIMSRAKATNYKPIIKEGKLLLKSSLSTLCFRIRTLTTMSLFSSTNQLDSKLGWWWKYSNIAAGIWYSCFGNALNSLFYFMLFKI